jgi:hypothetical protein
MDAPNVQGLDQVRFDRSNLYREEVVTDLKVGTIRVLTPITTGGDRDLGRPIQFFAQAQVVSQLGPLPVSAPIEATTLEEAINGYPAAVQAGIEALMEEAREMQRQEMSRIVVPNAETASKILK